MSQHGFLIDMDGVIYRGGQLIDGADRFIEELQRRDIPFCFLTNNSRWTRRDVVTKLSRMGIFVEERHVFTCAMATARFLASQHPRGTAYVIGEGGLLQALHQNGYSIVDDSPNYVVVGEGRTFNIEACDAAVNMILRGAKLIATNLDELPDGQWYKAWMWRDGRDAETATGIKAFSPGKPSPVMMRMARKELGLTTAETTMIGDTMETDILGAVSLGFRAALVLSGSTRRQDLVRYAYRPDIVVESIADLIDEDFLRGGPLEQSNAALV